MVYLGEQVETAEVTDDTVDFWETFAFSTGLKRKGEGLLAAVIELKSPKFSLTLNFLI